MSQIIHVGCLISRYTDDVPACDGRSGPGPGGSTLNGSRLDTHRGGGKQLFQEEKVAVEPDVHRGGNGARQGLLLQAGHGDVVPERAECWATSPTMTSWSRSCRFCETGQTGALSTSTLAVHVP